MSDCFVPTYCGRRFDLLEPRPEDVSIEHIAHSLATQTRWVGACRVPFSVADHSVEMCRIAKEDGCDAHILLAILMHDSEEAYTGDMPSGLKRHDTFFRKVAENIARTIRFALGIPDSPRARKLVKQYDRIAARAEGKLLLPHKDQDQWSWGTSREELLCGSVPDWQDSEQRFLSWWESLQDERDVPDIDDTELYPDPEDPPIEPPQVVHVSPSRRDLCTLLLGMRNGDPQRTKVLNECVREFGFEPGELEAITE